MRNGDTAMTCLFLVRLTPFSSLLAWAPPALAAADNSTVSGATLAEVLLIYTDGPESGWADWSWNATSLSRPNVIGQLLHNQNFRAGVTGIWEGKHD